MGDHLAVTCAGLNCQFTISLTNPDQGVAIASTDWDFGDGSTETTLATTVSHAYTKAFSGTATANVNLSGTASTLTAATTAVSVTAPAVNPQFAATCEFLACNFDASGSSVPSGQTITTYAWTFGDGQSTSGSAATASHVYAASGNNTVTLTITTSSSATGNTSQTVVTGAVGRDAQIAANTLQLILSQVHYAQAYAQVEPTLQAGMVSPSTTPLNTSGYGNYSCPGGGQLLNQGWQDSDTDPSDSFSFGDFQEARLLSGNTCTVSGITLVNPLSNDVGYGASPLNPGYMDAGMPGLSDATAWMSGESSWQQSVPASSGKLIAVSDHSEGSINGPKYNSNSGFLVDALSSTATLQSSSAFNGVEYQLIARANSSSDNCILNVQPSHAFSPDPACGITMDASDTANITLGSLVGWAYTFQGQNIPSGRPTMFAITTTTALDVEKDSHGNTYLKTGTLVITGYDGPTNYPKGGLNATGTGTSDLSVTLTATVDGSGNPAFQVTVVDPTVNGGASFSGVVPQSDWVSLPHQCTTSEDGEFGCVYPDDEAYYTNTSNMAKLIP